LDFEQSCTDDFKDSSDDEISDHDSDKNNRISTKISNFKSARWISQNLTMMKKLWDCKIWQIRLKNLSNK